MNRAERAFALLKQRGTIRMGDVAKIDQSEVYCFRNAISEAKKLAAAEGKIISHSYGKEWRDNSYTLVDNAQS
jgi:hypothetical protein